MKHLDHHLGLGNQANMGEAERKFKAHTEIPSCHFMEAVSLKTLSNAIEKIWGFLLTEKASFRSCDPQLIFL